MSDVPISKPTQPRTGVSKTQANTGIAAAVAANPSAVSSVAASSGAFMGTAMTRHEQPVHFEPPPSASLRVFNPEGNIEMELTMDYPTEEQVDALIDIFRNTRRMQ